MIEVMGSVQADGWGEVTHTSQQCCSVEAPIILFNCRLVAAACNEQVTPGVATSILCQGVQHTILALHPFQA